MITIKPFPSKLAQSREENRKQTPSWSAPSTNEPPLFLPLPLFLLRAYGTWNDGEALHPALSPWVECQKTQLSLRRERNTKTKQEVTFAPHH